MQPGGATALAPVLAAARAHVDSLSEVKHRFFVLLVVLSRPAEDAGELGVHLAAAAAELPLALLVVGLGCGDYGDLQVEPITLVCCICISVLGSEPVHGAAGGAWPLAATGTFRSYRRPPGPAECSSPR